MLVYNLIDLCPTFLFLCQLVCFALHIACSAFDLLSDLILCLCNVRLQVSFLLVVVVLDFLHHLSFIRDGVACGRGKVVISVKLR